MASLFEEKKLGVKKFINKSIKEGRTSWQIPAGHSTQLMQWLKAQGFCVELMNETGRCPLMKVSWSNAQHPFKL
jgi:hypothetical protein